MTLTIDNDGEVHILGTDSGNDDIRIEARLDPSTGNRFFEVKHRIVGDPGPYDLCNSGNTDCRLLGQAGVQFTHEITDIRVDLDETLFQPTGGDDILDLREVKPEFGYSLATSVSNPNSDEDIRVFGWNGHDTIYGSAFADCIKAGEVANFNPNDPITDNGWVYGGPGDDFLEGKAGSDHLYGEAGNDILLTADVGVDEISLNADTDDYLYGGPGDDDIFDSHGEDQLYGGLGVDSYFLKDDLDTDEIYDELIRDANGLGDFNGDGEIDRNWIDYPANVGNVIIEFDHDYTSAVDAVRFTVDKSGDPAIPIGTVNNRGDARFLLVETIDAMFDALEAYNNNGAYNGPYLAQWDFNDDNALKGYSNDVNAGDSDAKEFIHEIVGTTLGDADLDGDVDLSDMTVIGSHWQFSSETWNDGDLNGDGIVNVQDLDLWTEYWNP